MTAYYLTNMDYTNLQNVSFTSEAPTEVVQEVLKDKGFGVTLNELMKAITEKGYPAENRKK